MNRFALTLLALACCTPFGWADLHVVTSPDKTIEAMFEVRSGVPTYWIKRFGEDLIAPSRMGFRFVEGASMDRGFSVVLEKKNSADETWEQPWGERRIIRDRHNEMRLTLEQESGRRLVVVFRAFDDGVGFRYELPEQDGLDDFQISDELTEFKLPQDADCWWVPAFESTRYEYIYEKTRVGETRSVQTPLTIQRDDGVCLSIHEAALTDYSSMALTNVGRLTLEADLYPWSDGVKVRGKAPMKTPWRTLQVADTPADLLASDLILNLNEPSKIEDTSWIEPGKYVGVWWEMHVGRSTWGSGPNHGANTENVKRFIDFAADHGFKGVLVEGWNEGWDGDWMGNGDKFKFAKPYPDYDIKELARYGREKGVYLIGHHETAGAIGNYESQLEEAFAFCNRHGIRAVKSGYVEFANGIDRWDDQGKWHGEWHHGQFMVRHYRRVVEAAARHKIMMIVHEPIKDTGIRRTWPNMLTREGARGQEYNAWSHDGGNPASHTAILPFTRMLSGPMDFTPGVFDLKLDSGDRPNNQVNTTLAKQLALYVVIHSPMQMAVDFPEVYQSRSDALRFIKDVPVDWEETRPLAAKIGNYVAIARKERGGEEWFLGALTDETGRVLRAPLSFLDPGRVYEAQVYRDAEDAHWDFNPGAYVVESFEVDALTVLRLRLAPGGGQAIRFVPRGGTTESAKAERPRPAVR